MSMQWKYSILILSVPCYPVPTVGSSLPPLGLSFLQAAIREGVLVEAV